MRVTFGAESMVVGAEVMRLFRDVPVRTALQKVVQEPLKREGIETFAIARSGVREIGVTEAEASYFSKPILPDEVLVDERQRSAFSIISLAFKEDNKWRLSDGSTQISVIIEDKAFLSQVDANAVSFSKGDILVCDVRVRQTRNAEGLRTEYFVEKVVDHKKGVRQLPLDFDTPPSD